MTPQALNLIDYSFGIRVMAVFNLYIHSEPQQRRYGDAYTAFAIRLGRTIVYPRIE